MMISHNFAHKIQSNASKMSSAQITQCPPLNASTRVEAWTYGTIPGIPGAGPPLFGDPKAKRWKKLWDVWRCFLQSQEMPNLNHWGFHRDCTGRHGWLIHPPFYV